MTFSQDIYNTMLHLGYSLISRTINAGQESVYLKSVAQLQFIIIIFILYIFIIVCNQRRDGKDWNSNLFEFCSLNFPFSFIDS